MLKKITLAAFAVALLATSPVASAPAPAHAATSPYENLIADVAALERYAVEFQAANPSGDTVDELVLVYVRTGRPGYATGNWTVLGGARNTAFESFVAERDLANGTTAGALKTLDEVVLPNGDVTDAIHMFATMNLSLAGSAASADLGGWAGDVTDLLTEIRTATGDAAALQALAASRFRTPASAFSQPDVNGDLDAVNVMAQRRAAPSTPYADILSGYFGTLTELDRVRGFLENRFPAASLTRDGVRAAAASAYVGNVFISTPVIGLEAQRGITSAQAAHRVAAINAFADYLFDVLPVPVSGVSLDADAISLLVGETSTLTATVAPANATDRTVTWSSSDPAVATVDASGAVAAITRGEVVVTATTADGGLAASAAVTVRALPAFTTPPAGVTVDQGEAAELTAVVDLVGGVTMQWEVLAPGSETWAAIPGAGTASHTVPAADADSGAQYRLMLVNDAGSVASEPVTVTVRRAPDVVAPEPSPAPAAPAAEGRSQALADSGVTGIAVGVAAAITLMVGGYALVVVRRRAAPDNANVRGT